MRKKKTSLVAFNHNESKMSVKILRQEKISSFVNILDNNWRIDKRVNKHVCSSFPFDPIVEMNFIGKQSIIIGYLNQLYQY